MFHSASALARASATHIPKWNDLGPLRLPSPGADVPKAMRAPSESRRGTNVVTILAGGIFMF